MNCPKCKKPLDLNYSKVSFRTECPSCHVELHSCENCQFYYPGKPNDCSVPNSLFVRDRKAYNFCDDYQLKGYVEKKKANTGGIDQLFGEKVKKEAPSFDDLFKNSSE